MNDELQKRMFREMEQKQLFDKARDAAYAYADSASQRKVFPDSSALEKLTVFEEPLAEEPFDALEILSLDNSCRFCQRLLYGYLLRPCRSPLPHL